MTTTNTTNLNLTKAVPGTAEPFSTETFNANLDKIDEAVGEVDVQTDGSLQEQVAALGDAVSLRVELAVLRFSSGANEHGYKTVNVPSIPGYEPILVSAYANHLNSGMTGGTTLTNNNTQAHISYWAWSADSQFGVSVTILYAKTEMLSN